MTLALLLVDPQNDFFPSGALAVPGGDQVLAPINRLLSRHQDGPVLVTRDWHPPQTVHFQSSGGIWPPHCVQHTAGAEIHAEILLPKTARTFSKGQDPKDDAGYSGFEGREAEAGAGLEQILRAEGIESLMVAGLATDYCVKATVLDARRLGFHTFVYLPGIRPVEVSPGDGAKALSEMEAAGAYLVER